MELAKELEIGLSLSQLLPAGSSAFTREPEAHSAVFSAPRGPEISCFSACVFSPMVSNCSLIMGLNVHGYGVMARVGESALSLNHLGSEVFIRGYGKIKLFKSTK